MNKPEEEKHEKEVSVLRKNVPYNELFFYQKADAIYQLTYVFCQRFLPKYGDRTSTKSVQAARSGKQNNRGRHRRWQHINGDGAEAS